ncbi:HlyD family secretion protein [Pseudochelatococcus lubricantis]|uniref:HlyD family secretion protein n=1 Tax=Pseudochelatococcus lubricantis TaxID=1538102 RepID=A0ABX0V3J1_9HYPH|nr:secretion protein HlyD [Pseudochelatococcus lubricantis]NIJ59701.1 HlyD family secretion protein [Pseudochelatococcus lubricantis]
MKHGTLIILLIAAALAGGGAYYWDSRQPRGQVLTLGGNVDIREVNLSFRVAGRVDRVEVDEGDRVVAGQVVARIDPEPLRQALAQAEGALAAAQANEALLKAGTRAEDIARLGAQAEGLRAAAANAQTTFERQRTLQTTNISSRQALDNARAARDQANAGLEAAQQAYLAARNGARPEELAQAAAQRQAAQAQRDAADLQLHDATLASPSAGTVLTRAVEPGTMVAAGTTVVTLSLDRPVRVRAYAREPDLGRVAPGTKVLVYTDARPGEPYAGTVGFVSPRAEFTPKQVETQDLRTALVYRLRIVVDNADDRLRQGMPVTVRLADEAQPKP